MKKDNKFDRSEISTGIISWDSKPQLSKSEDLDWGAGVTDFSVKTDDFELKWSDDEDKDSDDSDGGISMNIGGKKEESKEEEEEENEEEEEYQQQIDIMAQQLKFVACLKILMEELSTLATGFEVDGNISFLIQFNY